MSTRTLISFAAGLEMCGHIEGEGQEAALVVADQLAVDENLRVVEDAPKRIQMLSCSHASSISIVLR